MNILYISYFYPPLGGPAAIRNVKTVKYLSQLGCQIDVLTINDIEYIYHDDSLLAETGQRSIIRTASWDAMALLKKLFRNRKTTSKAIYHNTPESFKLLIRRFHPLDDKVGWLPLLLKAGRKALSESSYDLIYISCGPFSSSYAAWRLGKESGIPYVVDWRDFWTTLTDYDLHGSRLNRYLANHYERAVMKEAAGIVCATQGIADSLADSYGRGLYAKMHIMYNGHDEADFTQLIAGDKDISLLENSSGYTLSYFGALYARRSLKTLLKAVSQLHTSGQLPDGFRLRMYGNYFVETHRDIAESGVSHLVEVYPQLPHLQALQAMQASDALLLVINSSSPYGTLSSKVFEYLRSGKPILALIPRYGEAAKLLKESGQSHIAAMESVSTVKSCLLRLLSGRDKPQHFTYPAAMYSRETQVTQLHRFISRILPDKDC